jgi:riboflavin kinase
MSRKDRPLIVGPEKPEATFPIFLKGPVIKGFGRGSKELGIPTGISSFGPSDKANIDDKQCEDTLKENGVYYGYAKVYDGDKQVEEMVMSVGFNPFYNNTVRSAV